MNNKSYFIQTFKHLLLGIVINNFAIICGYILLGTLNEFLSLGHKEYLVGIIITPIMATLLSHEYISIAVNYILKERR